MTTIQNTKLKEFAKRTAEILLDTKSVLLAEEKPFSLTSGKISPVYVDCRNIISFPNERKELMKMAKEIIKQNSNSKNLSVAAGGETAGIPYSAWIADLLNLPMAYIRKKPKGFGRCARIEGKISEDDNVLLVEDMTTDGGSKISFINAIKEAGGKCNLCFVVFSYGIFEEKIKKIKKNEGVEIISLANWWDIINVAVEKNYFKESTIENVKMFLKNPNEWRKENS